MATVYGYYLPGDPPGLLGRQKEDHVGDVIRLADTPQGDLFDQFLLGFRRDLAGLHGSW